MNDEHDWEETKLPVLLEGIEVVLLPEFEKSPALREATVVDGTIAPLIRVPHTLTPSMGDVPFCTVTRKIPDEPMTRRTANTARALRPITSEAPTLVSSSTAMACKKAVPRYDTGTVQLA